MATNSLRLRPLLPAALLAAALLFGGSAFVNPAAACAAPQEWDLGAYDKCVDQAVTDYVNGKLTDRDLVAARAACCTKSGGVWSEVTYKCSAPAAQPAEGAAVVPPGRIPTHTLEPAEPAPTNVVPTLAPASPD
jgi:hypothetical protein